MVTYAYDIVLQAPLGDRRGVLELVIQDKKVNGTLDALGYKTICSGVIDSEGNCSLQGSIKTFMSEFDYTGIGYVDNTRVDIKLSNSRNSFRLLGTACK